MISLASMLAGAPPGTLGLASPSIWINSELFPYVMKTFIQHSGSSKENPTILIIDNHESHLTIENLNLAKDNAIVNVRLGRKLIFEESFKFEGHFVFPIIPDIV